MHWDQNIIFIIIAAIVGISRLIARISEESKKQSQRPPQLPHPPGHPRPEYTQPLQRAQPKTDADRVREFLEALGQPAGSAPPPKIQPRTQIPPRPLAPVQPPSLAPEFRGWKEQARKIVVLQQPAKPVPPKIKRVVASSIPPAVSVAANEPGAWIAQEQVQTAPAPMKMAVLTPTDQPIRRATVENLWKQNLRSADSLQTAIILREIFGPPRGLQPLGT
jgi:hypothetical protein